MIDREAGIAAHRAWEAVRGNENECDAEYRMRHNESVQYSSEFWKGWLERSDEWRDEIGHETAAQTAPVVPNLADVAERIAGLIFAQTTCTMDVRKFEQVASSIIMQELSAAPSAPAPSEDAKRLDWLEAQGEPHYQWIARRSVTNRGYRLHQCTRGEGYSTPREAIDAAIAATAQQKESKGGETNADKA